MHELTLIFIGDLHGHLVPRADLHRHPGATAGGVARMKTLIDQIRGRSQAPFLVNAGDTIQGSAEALFTRGEALVRVVNRLGIDVFAPGNWDFLYGTDRFLELFAGERPRAPWGAIAANLTYEGPPYDECEGEHVLAPYRVLAAAGLRIGFLGLTTHRGPQLVGEGVTRGFRFGDGDAELAELIPRLRDQEGVDLLVLVSEMGLARNIQLARSHPGIDVVLSSDSHELTRRAVRLENGTVLVEPGQDGSIVGELALHRTDAGWNADWTVHDVTETVPEEPDLTAFVAEVRGPFTDHPDEAPVNPMNGRRLPGPIQGVVGRTAVALHRSGHTEDSMPAVIEGTAHDLIADALRAATDAEIASLRGFRFGTELPPGPIRLEDLYHWLPLGSRVAAGAVTGRQVREQLERSAHGSLAEDPSEWTGGWLFAYSGLRAELDPDGAKGGRLVSVDVTAPDGSWRPLADERTYRFAAIYHPEAPNQLNGLEVASVDLVRDDAGQALDVVEVVRAHLASLPEMTARPTTGRLRLTRPLRRPRYGNPELQPLG
jgi:2',3'-cyclic-nucleotide 2'-phosphodiesterase (5'-nucleotidase family)